MTFSYIAWYRFLTHGWLHPERPDHKPFTTAHGSCKENHFSGVPSASSSRVDVRPCQLCLSPRCLRPDPTFLAVWSPSIAPAAPSRAFCGPEIGGVCPASPLALVFKVSAVMGKTSSGYEMGY